MDMREVDLPGIGRKFEGITTRGDKVVVIVHDDGRREVHHYDDDDFDESISSVTFNDAEARQMAGILGGLSYKPKDLEKIELAFDDLVIEWFKVGQDSKVNNQTIGELDIRNQYDISIIAVLKHDRSKSLNPGPETRLEVGDTIVLSGERQNVRHITKALFSIEGGG
ncbi:MULTISPECIES: cation:proton antiporter regulatory subunit [unclassified Exiguobacterium]|uniref:cation:proton antiporter regulatory subunit n=1 Tax=unclassified Exiguobacterium TaxID=2644629 RepID=UPI00044F06B2|nr:MULTISPECIES: cation:proton antiporter regulatory subunit [unclassified Exiguobacterium]EZP61071.1 TrkA domain-containing protein [Exiguobacterium sp. RIT341]